MTSPMASLLSHGFAMLLQGQPAMGVGVTSFVRGLFVGLPTGSQFHQVFGRRWHAHAAQDEKNDSPSPTLPWPQKFFHTGKRRHSCEATGQREHKLGPTARASGHLANCGM